MERQFEIMKTRYLKSLSGSISKKSKEMIYEAAKIGTWGLKWCIIKDKMVTKTRVTVIFSMIIKICCYFIKINLNQKRTVFFTEIQQEIYQNKSYFLLLSVEFRFFI